MRQWSLLGLCEITSRKYLADDGLVLDIGSADMRGLVTGYNNDTSL